MMQFNVLSQHWPGGTGVYHGTPFRIAGILAKI